MPGTFFVFSLLSPLFSTTYPRKFPIRDLIVTSLMATISINTQGARNIDSRGFRLDVISVLVEQYRKLPVPDHINVCLGLQYLNRPEEVAMVLDSLSRGSDIDALQVWAYLKDLELRSFLPIHPYVINTFTSLF